MLVSYIGLPGSGKTTLAAKFAYRALSKGMPVYTNIPDLIGTIQIQPSDIGVFDISDGLVLLDECGIDWNSRKACVKGLGMSQDSIKWFKLHRHYNTDVIVFSQAQDFDITLRRLSGRMYIVTKSLIPWFTKTRQLSQKWVIDETSGEPRTQWTFVPLSSRWTFRPWYYGLFDSWAAPALPELPPERFPDGNTPRLSPGRQFIGRLKLSGENLLKNTIFKHSNA